MTSTTDAKSVRLHRRRPPLNVDHADTDWALRYRLAGYRSLSVGDVVTLAETAWACAPCGWTQLTTDQLSAALQA